MFSHQSIQDNPVEKRERYTMSSRRYSLPSSVIHCAKTSPSSPMEQVSRNPQFIFPSEKMEGTFKEGYEHWFDFSRILLPAHFYREQDRQHSSLEVGVCPPLIPTVQMVPSQPCWTELPRKRNRTTREDQENYVNNHDKDPREELIKREKNEEEEFNSAKRRLILKLTQDRESSEDREWKSMEADNDSKEISASPDEENKTAQSKMDESENKLSKTKLEEYLEKRRKNNASAKKSREARRMRELQTQIQAAYLEDENSKLRTIVGALRKENTHLRELLIV